MAPVRERLVLRQPGNWAWPKDDMVCFQYLRDNEPDIPDWVLARVPGRRTIVQAGGNCGTYARQYAEVFERVITFEPEAVNFGALVRNVDNDNTFFYRAFLSDKAGEAALGEDVLNAGAHYLWPGVVPAECKGPSTMVPMMKLDALGLTQVDLIHLDIEGHEHSALMGAFQTVNRCRPWIAIERRDELETRYGPNRLGEWFDAMAYELADSYKHEQLYRPLP